MCTILQKKVVSAVNAVLCPEWDLIASISTANTISVCRIMTWDKLAAQPISEFAEPSINVIMDFCHNGTKLFVASMGFGVLDIESGAIDRPTAAADLDVAAHAWISLESSNSKNDLIILSSNPHKVTVYANAQSPVAVVELQNSIPDSRLLCHISAYNCSLISLNTLHTTLTVGDVEMPPGIEVSSSYNSSNNNDGCLQAIEHAQFTLTTFQKRLKEAWRFLNPKLELMRTVLRTYQLEVDFSEDSSHAANNGIDGFLNSVLLGGLWHPAASVIFSQHWNEQGLQRQVSAFETAFGQLIEDLMLQGEWSLMQAYKWLQHHHSKEESSNSEDKLELFRKVLFAKDRLLVIAQKMRKQFRDFFEYLRVFMQEASGKSATADSKTEDSVNNEAAFLCSRIEELPSLDGGFDQVFATLLAEINNSSSNLASTTADKSISYGVGLHQVQSSWQIESGNTHNLTVALTNQQTITTTVKNNQSLLFDDYFAVETTIIRAVIEEDHQQSVMLKIHDVKHERDTFDLTLTKNRALRKVLVKYCPASGEDGVHVLAIFLQFAELFPPELCLVSFTAALALEDLEMKNRIEIKMLSKFEIGQFQLNLKRSTASFVGVNGALVLLDLTEALWDET